MNHLPPYPTMNQSAPPPDLRWEGIKQGLVTAFSMSLLYVFTVVPVGFIALINDKGDLFPTFDLQNAALPLLGHIATLYIGAFSVSGAAFMIGIFPALFVGAFGGGVIGGVLRTFIRRPLPRRALWRFALQTSLLLALGYLLLTWQFGFRGSRFDAIMIPIITIGPAIGVFFAFLWLSFRLHRLLPPAAKRGADG